MRKIVLYMTSTPDGMIAGPNDELGYHEPTLQEHKYANEFFAKFDTILMGRVIYQGFTEYWDAIARGEQPIGEPVPEVEQEFAGVFSKMRRVVFSRTLNEVPDNTVVIRDNLAEQVKALKQQPGTDLLLICGPELLGKLVELDLVDEYHLLVTPVVLGQGKALFRDVKTPQPVKLLSTKTFDSGSITLHYARA